MKKNGNQDTISSNSSGKQHAQRGMLVNERVERVRNDSEALNLFIEEYKPFIASCTERITGRYVRYGEDDELSIALMAFAEAIKLYDSEKGAFLSFARKVIKRRLIDYYRSEKRNSNVISLEYQAEDDAGQDLSIEESIDRYSEEEISEYRRIELGELKKELFEWGITFADLVEASPKHARTRKICMNAINYLLSRPDMIDTIKKKKYLPISEIEHTLKIPRKNIERARKYIIAVIIIKTGDYQYIKDYINIGEQ